MKKLLLASIFFILLLSRNYTVFAADTRFIHEIHDININDNYLIISGWALVNNSQNYIDNNTHSYELVLQSAVDELVFKGVLSDVTQTANMKSYGIRMCNNDELFKQSSQCNYKYENVGFTFSVPLSALQVDRNYKINLRLLTHLTKQEYKTPIFYSSNKLITHREGQVKYTIDSDIMHSKLKVVNDNIPVRLEPSMSSIFLESSRNCTNKPHSYFKVNSVYNNIFDTYISENNLFYKLKGKYSSCMESSSYIEEGNDIHSVWISASNVEVISNPLEIITETYNTDPVITIENHPVVSFGTVIDKNVGVSAYDEEDGDLTNRIKIEEDNYLDYPGQYKIKYSVTDNFGSKVYATMNIIVFGYNDRPRLLVNDAVIQQYEDYNAYNYAKAYDYKLNDISDKIIVHRKIDSFKLGNFDQCYSVTDSDGFTDYKCASVSVISNEKQFRFIQIKKLFHKETVPNIWIKLLNIINKEINNEIIYDSLTIDN